MKTKITVLCENSIQSPLPFIGEHGLSFFIEIGNDTTLFDTGQGLGIVHNSRILGKKLSAVDRIVLSHGHYDHTGGLMAALGERSGPTPVHLHPAAFNEKRAVIPTGAAPVELPIGMRASRADYEGAGAAFHEIEGFTEVAPSIRAISSVKRPPDWKTWDTRLKQKTGGVLVDDPFDDDLSLLVDTESGPVVLLGCAHAGIVEILDDLAARAGVDRFHAVIGGTHLESAPEPYVDRAVECLRRYGVRKIAVSHCSGFGTACRFASTFPAEFATASVGSAFEF